MSDFYSNFDSMNPSQVALAHYPSNLRIIQVKSGKRKTGRKYGGKNRRICSVRGLYHGADAPEAVNTRLVSRPHRADASYIFASNPAIFVKYAAFHKNLPTAFPPDPVKIGEKRRKTS
jgi:hypothetical protein